MSRGSENNRGKSSDRQGGKDNASPRGGKRPAGKTGDNKKSTSRDAVPEKPAPRGGKNQIVGTSRAGKPVLKKEYIARKKSETKTESKKDDGIRLNKYIANSGICSRRDADIYIQSGNVHVNDIPVTEMGHKVQPNDIVKFDGQQITPGKKEYFLLNKPKGFITPRTGERTSKTVFDLMATASSSNLFAIGSLNRKALGLMLFTNDLEIANKLNNPKKKIRKIYHVSLDRNFKHEDLTKLRAGVHIDDELIEIQEANFVEGGRNNEVGVEIHYGKDNTIARIFEKLGYEIKVLDRVVIGGLTKKDLPRGNYRVLGKQEVVNLIML